MEESGLFVKPLTGEAQIEFKVGSIAVHVFVVIQLGVNIGSRVVGEVFPIYPLYASRYYIKNGPYQPIF